MSQVFMLHVENIEILDTYDREMKIAKKPVETLTPRGLHKIKIKIKKKKPLINRTGMVTREKGPKAHVLHLNATALPLSCVQSRLPRFPITYSAVIFRYPSYSPHPETGNMALFLTLQCCGKF